nr:hypothetical protein [Tanacetum cinerariifolium]
MRKCNGRLNPGKKQRKPTFQAVMDALALTLCYFAFLTTTDVPKVYMHQFWDSIHKCINLGELLPLSSIEVYLERQLKVRKFKKLASPKLSTVLASPEEPTRKSKRVKRPSNKSFDASTPGVVIRETLVKCLSKKKKKMIVDKCKGIHLLSEVALTEEAYAAKVKPFVTNEGTGVKPRVPDVNEEESTKSEVESWGKDEDDSNNKQDSRSEGSDQERDSGDDNTLSDSEKGSYFEHETDENESDDEDETKINDKAEGDEDKGMDYTTNQFHDDVDLRINEPVTTDEGFIQKEGTDDEMSNVQQGNENPKTTLNQVIKDAHVTLSIIPKKIDVLVTNSSQSSDLASKFLKFLDIPHTEAEIVSPMDVHVHYEVPSNQTPTLFTVPISVVTESSSIFTTVIQSLPSFNHPPQQSTQTTEVTNPLSTLLNFASIFQFNNRVTTLENEVVELKRNDPLNTQVTALVDEPLDSRLAATRDEFISYLSALITTRITEQRSRKDKDKDEDLSTGSNRGLKKRKISKDVEPKTGLKTKESKSGSSKGGKSQSKSFGKSVQSEEPEFEVVDSDMPQDQEENLGNKDEEPRRKVASKRDWFTKPSKSQEPTDPDWNVGKTPQQGPTQSWLMTLTSFVDKPSKTFDGLMSTRIDFSSYIINSLKITNLIQETLLGPAFKLLKGTRTNYAELEYDFEECYKALSEKLDWDNLEGGDYPFDLTKPLPLVKNGNRQMVPVDYFFKSDLKYLQGGISTMTYTTSIKKTKAAQYDLLGEGMAQNIWSPVKVAYDKHLLWEYLPRRRWSSLEKKIAHIMIKAINKQLKERQMMRSFEKFVGGRHYKTDLRLLQRTT